MNLEGDLYRYRLEFNAKQQSFHLVLLNKGNVVEENTCGWQTIYKAGREDFLMTFIDYVEWRYKERRFNLTKNLLSIEMRAYKFIIGRTKTLTNVATPI